jgi:hypothetical protein
MTKSLTQIAFPTFRTGSILLLVMLAAAVGAAMGNGWLSQPTLIGGGNSVPIPVLADSAVKGKTMSMATGAVTTGVEGLYVLDHSSGLLQCWIMNPRNGAVGGIFQTNVLQDLPTDKVGSGDYVMVTGAFVFSGGTAANLVPSASIVYVADEATGNVVGYSFNFNRNELNRGVMQHGPLRAVCAGPTRVEGTVRDQ